MYADNQIHVCKISDNDFSMKLKKCLKNGYPLLIENVEEYLDPIMNPLFMKDFYKRGLQTLVKIGETEYIYN